MRKQANAAVLYLSVILLVACAENKQDKLDKYSERELVEIVVDISLARSATLSLPETQADSMKRIYYLQIEELHELSEGELEGILMDFEKNPSEFKQYLEAARDSIRQRNERKK